MQSLVLDVKVLIASHDEKVWYSFYRYDEDFKKYTLTPNGKKMFINLFTVCVKEIRENYQCEKYYLFDKLHHHTLPAITYMGIWRAYVKKNKFTIISNRHVAGNYPQVQYKIWYYNGKVHNINTSLPSIISNEYQMWYDKGKIHRKILPAVIYTSGKQEWYHRGLLHRLDDLPAMIDRDDKDWYYKGKRHRENDQPAVMNNSSLEWWYNNKPHRENDLPAIMDDDMDEWYYNGKCHRDNDLPAIMYKNRGNVVYDCEKEWWYDGLRHRENNLPAVIWFNGKKEWWYEGKRIKKPIV